MMRLCRNAREDSIWVNEKDMHYRLTTRCLLVCEDLRKNICGLPSDGTRCAEIDQQTIDHCLPPELQYSRSRNRLDRYTLRNSSRPHRQDLSVDNSLSWLHQTKGFGKMRRYITYLRTKPMEFQGGPLQIIWRMPPCANF
ncbi:hypothetical protein N7501_003803 [Penicillium viridicatum]|nr:hypothetical protein N7501_003803 [Penicillium viridicatum]